VTHEELGGAAMHAAVSGTIDYREKDEPSCIGRLRRLIEVLPDLPAHSASEGPDIDPSLALRAGKGGEYDARQVITALLDAAAIRSRPASSGRGRSWST